jgi:CDP-glucose 4,6-dehydratase
VENLVNPSFWNGRRVFVTGHTGFKGSWLSLWLTRMGANVTGFSLAAEEVSLFRQAGVIELVEHVEGDIRDLAAVEAAMAAARPDVVFHLAAQPLVRLSYECPVETYATNVQGTVHLLDACRRIAGVKAIVCVTSDKCYENREWLWPYRENDPLGGHDPYSSSKGAAELVISAYRRSYFSGGSGPLLASVRAGNVIGGGDWALDRLVPDIVRALLAGQKPLIRNPDAIRPWQHVLEALGGYLAIAERLVEGQPDYACAWNFGPADSDNRPVSWIAGVMTARWGTPGWEKPATAPSVHEAHLLKLDCAKARSILGWSPTWSLETALERIVDWHRAVGDGADARTVSLAQLDAFRVSGGQ